jgi:diguanylate cyclase (GGDEF)-like protein/PAS domain S-box-containing protein
VSSPPSPALERLSLSWPFALGLERGQDDALAAVADARLAAMRRRRPIWLAVHCLATLGIVIVRLDNLGWPVLAPWLAGMGGILALIFIGGRRHSRPVPWWRDPDVLGGALLGIAWAVASALFTGALAGSAPSFTVLAIGCAMLGITPALMAAAPIGGLAFILSVGGSVAAAMLAGGGEKLATVTTLYTLTITGTFLANIRMLIARIAAEQALAGKEDVIRLLLREFEDSSADWLWRVDAAKCLVDVSGQLAAQFGREAAMIEGRPLLQLLAGDGWERGDVAPAIRDLAEKLRLRESFRDLVVPVQVAGERRWWSLSATPRRDERGMHAGFRGVGTDVTERESSAERMDRMARFDALTGLANRAHVIDALGTALREAHYSGGRSALMLIDLDRFKQINDTLGHPVGDRLLIEVANRLGTLAGPCDVCGRLGGDEFAMVIADASDRDRVEWLGRRMVELLSAPFEIGDHILHIGGSVGSATSPRDGRAVETLLRNADLALYRAKDDGRGVHRAYEPQLHAEAEQRRRIELALRDALERGEFSLVYQPIVEAAAGRLVGFEAFLRWVHPEFGAISPDVFIPIAEEARLIGRIGDWVMHTACRDAAAWPDDIRVSVNMAPAQLRDPQLPATIVSALSHSGLLAQRLELEIAEEVFVRDDGLTEVVDRILAIGVRITLDDFGTGRSSLAYLRKGRFSTVKIDRSFVRGASANGAESIAIVRALVAMADSLGMTTIAEGAETRAEYDRMRALGCRQVQGWLVGQPIDAEAATELAQARTGERVVRAI